MSADRCTYCDCQEFSPCDGGCGWANDARTICTQCATAMEIASELVRLLGIVALNPKAGIRLATAKWELLPLEQQRVLVATCRLAITNVRQALEQALTDEATEAIVELHAISSFLLERCGDQIGPEDSASEVVIRLLSPHVGSRIVLPAGARR